MKNTLVDLNNYLFEQIERLQDDSLSDEDFEKEVKRSEAMTKISEKIIANGELAFKTMKHMDEYGYGQTRKVPKMLEGGGGLVNGNQ